MAPKKLLFLFQVLLVIFFLLVSAMAARNVERTANTYEKAARELIYKPQKEDDPWGHGYIPPVTKPDRT
ncbi:hypothetical protein QUC31_007964 [Theobroma cacao]|nr:hypothetical protein QQP08_011229 [Theobroma cacao]